jgi:uncharacterized protein (DUF924 family)
MRDIERGRRFRRSRIPDARAIGTKIGPCRRRAAIHVDTMETQVSRNGDFSLDFRMDDTNKAGEAERSLQTRSEPSRLTLEQAASVLGFWRDAGPSMWFAKDPDFDRRFRERFIDLHEAACRGELEHWMTSPEGSLALVILLDQFPRNAFRGTARMYASDAQALAVAGKAIARNLDLELPTDMRLFLYLPFGHSESLAMQERSVQLNRALSPLHLKQALHHRDIVHRFGRFPHRNSLLGRPTTPDEQRYLDAGGYTG